MTRIAELDEIAETAVLKMSDALTNLEDAASVLRKEIGHVKARRKTTHSALLTSGEKIWSAFGKIDIGAFIHYAVSAAAESEREI